MRAYHNLVYFISRKTIYTKILWDFLVKGTAPRPSRNTDYTKRIKQKTHLNVINIIYTKNVDRKN